MEILRSRFYFVNKSHSILMSLFSILCLVRDHLVIPDLSRLSYFHFPPRLPYSVLLLLEILFFFSFSKCLKVELAKYFRTYILFILMSLYI